MEATTLRSLEHRAHNLLAAGAQILKGADTGVHSRVRYYCRTIQRHYTTHLEFTVELDTTVGRWGKSSELQVYIYTKGHSLVVQ